MPNIRTPMEIAILKQQAHNRMRAGDTCADIARDLGIAGSTLGSWASEGRWRKGDIAFERSEERSQALLARIAETQLREQAEAERRAAKAKALGEAALKAMQAADPDGKGAPPGRKAQPTHQLSLAMAHDLLQQGQLEDAERAARFALRFAQAQKATNGRDAAQWRADRESILAWWEEHRDGFIAFHREASNAIEELKSAAEFERHAQRSGVCPTRTRPADFWPAEMHEVRDEIFEQMEEEGEAEAGAAGAVGVAGGVGNFSSHRAYTTAERPI